MTFLQCFLLKKKKKKEALSPVSAHVFPPFTCWAVAQKTPGVQSDVGDRAMGGRASLPYLVPRVGPGPSTLTFHVTSEAAQAGSDCSHSSEEEVVPPSGHHERQILEALKQVDDDNSSSTSLQSNSSLEGGTFKLISSFICIGWHRAGCFKPFPFSVYICWPKRYANSTQERAEIGGQFVKMPDWF